MSVSDQVAELRAEFARLLAHLQGLIDNRSQWQDGIEGCHAALTLLRDSAVKVQAIHDDTVALEENLTSARAAGKNWSAMHADLGEVAKQLREECDAQRDELLTLKASRDRLAKTNADIALAAKQLRAECAQLHSATEQRAEELNALRAELAALKKDHVELSRLEPGLLRAECAQLRATIEEQSATLARTKALAKKLASEAA